MPAKAGIQFLCGNPAVVEAPGLTEAGGDYAAAGVSHRPRGGPFQYPEDLLQVLGVSYPLYDRVRGLLTVRGGGAGIAPQAASEDVLTLLAGGDREQAARIAATPVSYTHLTLPTNREV